MPPHRKSLLEQPSLTNLCSHDMASSGVDVTNITTCGEVKSGATVDPKNPPESDSENAAQHHRKGCFFKARHTDGKYKLAWFC